MLRRRDVSLCFHLRVLALFFESSSLFRSLLLSHQHVTAFLSSDHRINTRWIRDHLTCRLQDGLWDDDANGSSNDRLDNLFSKNPPRQQHTPYSTPDALQPFAASLTPLKVMIFIDGTWLYYQIYEREHSRDVMAQKLGMNWKQEYEIDWSRLPMVACQRLLQDKKSSWSSILPAQMDSSSTPSSATSFTQQRPIEVLRVSVYSSLHRDTPEDSYRFQMFKNMAQAGFDINIKPKHGRGSEKCVDIQLAVDMLYYATVPDAYDIALLLTGDRDFLPAVVRCRQKGRRIGVVSMRSAAADAFDHTPNLKDYDTIWLEDYLNQWTTKRKTPLIPKTIHQTGIQGALTGPLNSEKGTDRVQRRIPESILNRVITDFVVSSKAPRVSSRDVGRYLKLFSIGNRSLLEETKKVYGGLYQFLTLAEIYVVEGDSRRFSSMFWVSMKPGVDTTAVLNEVSQPDEREKMNEEEIIFVSEYSRRPEIKEKFYEFTFSDMGPNGEADLVDISPLGAKSQHKRDNKFPSMTNYTVPQLKEICRGMGLPVSGRKADLIERILDRKEDVVEKEGSLIDKVDPKTRLEMLVLEYIHAAGGEASSRDIGRYLAANKASSQRLQEASEGTSGVTSLMELKELFGGLLRFIEWSSLFTKGKEIFDGSKAFTVMAAKDAERKLEERIASTVPG